MFSDQLTRYATERLNSRAKLLEPVMPEVEAALASCESDDERVLLSYLYGTLPVTDCIDVQAEVLRSYVRHALFLREEMPWARELGEGMFVHYVLFPRVNSEPLVDCRPLFFGLLRDRVAGLSSYEAVREVNYWCCEMATYQTTNDRTLSPVAVLMSGNGRCGEESTFLVTALRSLGIPARQIYTPWWSHCDDNHAWVEAYANGAWHYLGACEPEEELDRGWFTNASGRALMEETRLYSDYRDASLDGVDAGRVGCTHLVDVTENYAISREFTVRVVAGGKPVEDATVSLEVLNMAFWPSAATLLTGVDGTACVRMGLGSVRVHASKGSLMGFVDVNTKDCQEVEVQLAEAVDALPAFGEWHDLDFFAPDDNPAPSHAQTPEQDARARARKAAADELRRERVGGFSAHAAELAKRWPGSEDAFANAFANADEVARFLGVDDGADRLELLGTLKDKDFRDLRADVLESHLEHARAVQAEAEARLVAQGLDAVEAHDVYVRYVLCPRGSYEELNDYRPFILGFFDDERREAFTDDPRGLWAWINDHISYDEANGVMRLIGTPRGALRSGVGSVATRSHLFVAVCRTLGVAARISVETNHPEFMLDGAFVPVQVPEVPRTGRVDVAYAASSQPPAYFSGWCVEKLEGYVAPNGSAVSDFRPQDLSGISFEGGVASAELAEGTYRLVTTSRLPSGNQQASEFYFEVRPDAGPQTIDLRLREPDVADMLNTIQLPGFSLKDGRGQAVAPALGERGLGVLAFCAEGMEPTEHLLNELRERADDLRTAGLAVTVVLRGEQALADPTLTRTCAALPELGVVYDDFSELPERLARRTYANPELLPLTLLLRAGEEDGRFTSLYSTAGYNVGTVDLLLRLAAIAG